MTNSLSYHDLDIWKPFHFKVTHNGANCQLAHICTTPSARDLTQPLLHKDLFTELRYLWHNHHHRHLLNTLSHCHPTHKGINHEPSLGLMLCCIPLEKVISANHQARLQAHWAEPEWGDLMQIWALWMFSPEGPDLHSILPYVARHCWLALFPETLLVGGKDVLNYGRDLVKVVLVAINERLCLF